MNTETQNLELKEVLNRIAKCTFTECFLYNLAVDRKDENTRRYHLNKVKGIGSALGCMDVSIYVHHENDMPHRKIECFTLAHNGEIVVEVSDFEGAFRGGMTWQEDK